MLHLDKGIFLEDKSVLLEWGQPEEKLASVNQAKIINHVDRTVVHWGTHTILGGLTLELTNTYLGEPNKNLSKEFKWISSWVQGDVIAKRHFDLISKHLINKIGEPTGKRLEANLMGQTYWLWATNEVTITLSHFHLYTIQTCLTIEQKVDNI